MMAMCDSLVASNFQHEAIRMSPQKWGTDDGTKLGTVSLRQKTATWPNYVVKECPISSHVLTSQSHRARVRLMICIVIG